MCTLRATIFGLLRFLSSGYCSFCLRAAAVFVFGLLWFRFSGCCEFCGFCLRTSAILALGLLRSCLRAAAVLAYGLCLRTTAVPAFGLLRDVYGLLRFFPRTTTVFTFGLLWYFSLGLLWFCFQAAAVLFSRVAAVLPSGCCGIFLSDCRGFAFGLLRLFRDHYGFALGCCGLSCVFCDQVTYRGSGPLDLLNPWATTDFAMGYVL